MRPHQRKETNVVHSPAVPVILPFFLQLLDWSRNALSVMRISREVFVLPVLSPRVQLTLIIMFKRITSRCIHVLRGQNIELVGRENYRGLVPHRASRFGTTEVF